MVQGRHFSGRSRGEKMQRVQTRDSFQGDRCRLSSGLQKLSWWYVRGEPVPVSPVSDKHEVPPWCCHHQGMPILSWILRASWERGYRVPSKLFLCRGDIRAHPLSSWHDCPTCGIRVYSRGRECRAVRLGFCPGVGSAFPLGSGLDGGVQDDADVLLRTKDVSQDNPDTHCAILGPGPETDYLFY